MKTKVSHSVFRRYLITHISIALFVLALVSAVVLSVLLYVMQNRAESESSIRTAGATNEMNELIKKMEDIQFRIKSNSVYLPILVKQGTMNEIELIKDFEKYSNYLPLENSQYIYYQEMDAVYSGSARYSFDVLLRYILKPADIRAFSHEIDDIRPGSGYRLYELNDKLAFAFPLSLRGSKVVMLFVFQKRVVAERLSYVAGLEPDDITLVYEDRQVLGKLSPDQNAQLAQVGDGQLMVAVSSSNVYRDLQNVTVLTMAMLVGITLLSVPLAVYLAKKNYKPINEIIKSYTSDCVDAADELTLIGNILKQTVIENRRLQEQNQNLSEKAYGKKGKAGDVTEEIMLYINKHFLDVDMSLSSLCDIFKLSDRHIARLIKAETGMSYKEWLIERRIEHAKYLLRVKNMNVSETGAHIGYVNISHFIKSFKDIVGMTPAVYRTLSTLSDDKTE